MSAVFEQSGSTLPQVSAAGGSINGTVHIVTSDGAGPYTAIVDPTGTGAFSKGTEATVTTQVPGKRGNIAPSGLSDLIPRALVNMGIAKRAVNINEDFPIAIQVPAGTTCTGTVGGQSNVCLMKIVNPSLAGPFGGVIAFQVANTTAAANGTTVRRTTSVPGDTERFVGVKFRA